MAFDPNQSGSEATDEVFRPANTSLEKTNKEFRSDSGFAVIKNDGSVVGWGDAAGVKIDSGAKQLYSTFGWLCSPNGRWVNRALGKYADIRS